MTKASPENSKRTAMLKKRFEEKKTLVEKTRREMGTCLLAMAADSIVEAFPDAVTLTFYADEDEFGPVIEAEKLIDANGVDLFEGTYGPQGLVSEILSEYNAELLALVADQPCNLKAITGWSE